MSARTAPRSQCSSIKRLRLDSGLDSEVNPGSDAPRKEIAVRKGVPATAPRNEIADRKDVPATAPRKEIAVRKVDQDSADSPEASRSSATR